MVLAVCLLLRLSVSFCICLYLRLSVSLYACLHFVCLTVCLPTCLPVCLTGCVCLLYSQHTCGKMQVRSIGKRDCGNLFKLGDEMIIFLSLHQLLAASVADMLPVNVSVLLCDEAKKLARQGNSRYEPCARQSVGLLARRDQQQPGPGPAFCVCRKSSYLYQLVTIVSLKPITAVLPTG